MGTLTTAEAQKYSGELTGADTRLPCKLPGTLCRKQRSSQEPSCPWEGKHHIHQGAVTSSLGGRVQGNMQSKV